MARLTLQVIGVERVASDLSIAIPDRIREQVRAAVDRIGAAMEARVRANLTGGVLKVRTGTLSGAIVRVPIDKPGFIGTKVGVSNDGYVGRFYEKGFDGPMDVGSYVRHSVKGRATQIKARVRQIRNSHRPWLTPVLDANRSAIQSELAAALEKAMPREI